MNYQEFEEELVKRVKEVVGSDACVRVQDVRKNNNVLLRGLTVLRKGQSVSPTIYLNSFYEMLKNGTPLDVIVRRILEVYVKSLPQNKVDMDFFKDFTQVKDRIAYRLINREKNKELLADIPHVDYMDLAVCFYYSYWHPEMGEGIIQIHNSHLEMWNIETKELMRLANINTPQLMPAQLCAMDEVLKGILEDKELEGMRQLQQESGKYLYVLSNEKRCHGAATILYPGILEETARHLGGNIYILPSSIHEVILLCDDGRNSSEYLHMMIEDINRSQLREEEVLSDYAYYYDMSTGRLIETH